MDDANLGRAIAVLERRPHVGLPLMVLHAAMHRNGAANLTLAALEQDLRDRTDLFAVVDPPPLPWDVGLWPANAVSGYRQAFGELGLAAETFVVLRPDAGEVPTLAALLRATVVALREDSGAAARTDAVGTARALQAANATNASWHRASRRHGEMSRTTIRPLDRPPPARDGRRGLLRRPHRLPSA